MDLQKFTINLKDTAVGVVLETIESKSDFNLYYSSKVVDLDRIVSVNVNDENLFEVLDQLFDGTDVEYEVMDKDIVLKSKGSEAIPAVKETKQQHEIKGTVVDVSGAPIIGALVQVDGTNNATISAANGAFTIKADPSDLLVVSFMGYSNVKVSANKDNVTVQMKQSVIEVDEVVVVGYGTQKKGEVASAITSVKAESFVKTPSPDAAQLIKGQVAGLNISMPDSDPTSTSQISLRGTSTLKANAAPLVLIDGVPGDLDAVSPDDIEQIDVLKDGSAAAIYGTRGTNGVIIITTKNTSGEMPTTVNFNSYISTQQITKKLDFFNADEYRNLVKAGKTGAADHGDSVDWLDEIMQTPLTQVYNLGIQGGSKQTNYTASLEYRSLNGVMKRSDNQIVYPRIQVTHRMFNNKLKLTANLNGFKKNSFAGTADGGYNSNIYRNAMTYNPTTPVMTDGTWSESGANEYFNPVALVEEVEGENKITQLRMFGQVQYSPTKDININYIISSTTTNKTIGYSESQEHYSSKYGGLNGYASRTTIANQQDLSELTAQWSKTFNDHSFKLLAGYSWMRANSQNYSMSNYDFPSSDYTYNNMGAGQALKDGKATEYSYQSESILSGYFARLNYNYKGKYLFAASIRREGSTKFGENHKWGNFPSVSAAWDVMKERFMENSSLFSQLKVRGGYGVTGIEPTSPYMSLNTLDFNYYAYYNGDYMKSIRPSSNPNPDLRWETKKETNVGVDFGFFDNRLNFTVDYYVRNTNDMLWDYTVASPPYLYPNIIANAGSMKNSGLEVSVMAIPVQTKNFTWNTSLNYSTNKNTLVSLSNDQFISSGYSDQGHTGEPIQQSTHRLQEGEPIGNFWGYKSVDIDADGRWIIEGADGKPKPISEQQPDDKQVIGNGLPKHYLNWNNTITYKNFDLNILMRGAFDYDILNTTRMNYEAPVMLSRGNLLSTAYDLVYGKCPLSDTQELQYVSYYVEKGDYWKIDNVTLGYTFDLKSEIVKNLRIFGSISNLLTITDYSGIDPEVQLSGLAPGVDNRFRYPSARTYTFGVSVKF